MLSKVMIQLKHKRNLTGFPLFCSWVVKFLPLLVCCLFGLHGADRQPVQGGVVAGETPLPLWLHDIILQPHQVVQSEQLRRQLLPGLHASGTRSKTRRRPRHGPVYMLEHEDNTGLGYAQKFTACKLQRELERLILSTAVDYKL